jgi:parallel beta-helix repeat protein
VRFFLLIALTVFFATPAVALVVEQDTVWDGQHSFSEDVQVLAGATLTVLPGSRLHFSGARLDVSGRLVAEGAEFSGENWEGLRLKGVDNSTRIKDCVIKGAATGLFVQGGAPQLEGMTLSANKVGMEVRGKAAGKVTNCRFTGNLKVGLFIKDDSTTSVVGCRFEGNLRYGAYLYHARPQMFQGNKFVNNDTGLMIAYHGTDPEVLDNQFEKNTIAVQVDRAARPVLRGNLLLGNQTGFYIYRRSDPLLTGNRIEGNGIGLLIAYSSYPEVESNDFLNNEMAVKLEFQSSSWEAKRGADARAGETSARSAFAGQGMRSVSEEDRRAKRLDGMVNAGNNWWGREGTLELASIGPDGNPSFIHDGRDQTTFVDEGEEYPLDKVAHSPWRKDPATEIER